MTDKQIIQQILDLRENEIDEFIEKRIEELEKTATEDREQISPFAIMRSSIKKLFNKIISFIKRN